MSHSASTKTKTGTKKQVQTKRPFALYIAFTCALLILLGGFGVWYYANTSYRAPNNKPLSRAVLELSENEVRISKPAPTLAALQYAYIATAYAEGLTYGGAKGGLFAVRTIASMLYANRASVLNKEFDELAKNYHIQNNISASNKNSLLQVVTTLQNRYQHDGHDLVWDGVIPKGRGKWYKTVPADPFTPRAGEWQRWLVSKAIAVPPPPTYGSTQDLTEVANVRRESASRTGEDIRLINFWGGVPGSDSPGGIWQNQLYKILQNELPKNAELTDVKYAKTQQYLAEAVSDAFMECWKVKFMYWTARPDMRDPSIITAMPNPNFPSYISGHSTISKAAADVLSVIAPSHTKDWQAMALEARNSRLKAGIHFEYDNVVGFEVGTEVANQIIATSKLGQIF